MPTATNPKPDLPEGYLEAPGDTLPAGYSEEVLPEGYAAAPDVPMPDLTRAAESPELPLRVANEQERRHVFSQRKENVEADVAANPPTSAFEKAGEVVNAFGRGVRQTVKAAEWAIPPVKALTRPFENEHGEIQPIGGMLKKLAGGTDVAGSSMLEQSPIVEGATDFASALLTPENAGLALGMAALPAAGVAALSALFGAQMTVGAFSQIPGIREAAHSGNWWEVRRLATTGSLELAAGGFGLAHGAKAISKPFGRVADVAENLADKLRYGQPREQYGPFAPPEPAGVDPMAGVKAIDLDTVEPQGPHDPMEGVRGINLDELAPRRSPFAPAPAPLKARVDAEKAAIEDAWTPEKAERRVTARPLTPETQAQNEKWTAQRLAQDAVLDREIGPVPPLDPTTLETIEPAGESTIEATGVNGEPLHPLLPPDRAVRDAVNNLFQGEDPQTMAQTVAMMYGIEEPIEVRIGDDQTPANTTLENGVIKMSVPPGVEPYQVAHEMAFEARRLTGRLTTEPPHDNNIIMARFLEDARMAIGEAPKAPPVMPNPPHVEGEAQAAQDGSPMTGAPEAPRITNDKEFLDLEKRRGGTDVGMSVLGPLDPRIIGPPLRAFGKHSVKPAAINLLEGVAQSARLLQTVTAPRTLVPEAALDAYMEAYATKSKAMATFRLNLDFAKARSLFDRMSRAEQVAFVDTFQLGEAQSSAPIDVSSFAEKLRGKRHSTSLARIAELIKVSEDASFGALNEALLKDGGEGLSYLANHLANSWERRFGQGQKIDAFATERAKELLAVLQANARSPFEGSKGFMKKRIYETMSEGIAAGLKPVTYNPIVMMEIRLADNLKFLSARKMLETLGESGHGAFAPIGTDRAFLDMPEHQGWVSLRQHISNRYFPSRTGKMEYGTWYFEPNVARIMRNYLGYDIIRASNMGRGLMAIKNVTTSIELGLSAFHFVFVNTAASGSDIGSGARNLMEGNATEGLKQLGRGIIPGASGTYLATEGGRFIRYSRDKEAFKESHALKDQKFMQRWGGEAHLDKLIDDLFRSGALVGADETFRSQTWGAVKDAMSNHDPIGVVLRAIPAINMSIMRPLMNVYIPRLKIGEFMKEYSTSLLEHADALARGDISEAAVGRKAWDRTENRFGQVNPDNLAWPPMFRTAMTFFLRSVTWQVGNVRTIAGAGMDLGRGIRSAADNVANGMTGRAADFNDPMRVIGELGGKSGSVKASAVTPKLGSDLAFLLGTAVNTAVMGSISQKFMMGKWPWETDTPLTDAFFPRNGDTDEMGRPSRNNYPSYIRNYVGMARSAKALSQGRGSDAARYFTSMTSLPVMRFLEVAQNKDYYGNWVYDEYAPQFQRALQMLYHQFKVPVPISIQSGLQGGNARAVVAGFFGLTRAPAAYFYTEGEEAIANARRKSGAAFPGRDPDTKAQMDALRRIRTAVDSNREPDEADLELAPPKAIDKAYADHALGGFESRFDDLSPRAMVGVWEYFNADEKAKAYPILMKKAANMKPGIVTDKVLKAVDQISAEMEPPGVPRSPA